MAVSSIATTLIPSLTTSNSPTLPHKATSKFLPFCSNTHFSVPKPFLQSKGRVFSSPEALTSQGTEDQDEEERFSEEEQGGKKERFVGGVEESESLSVSAEADQVVSKQKIRIKLRSFYVRLIEDSVKQIMDAARNTNAKTMGPVPLPNKRKIFCVLKSPHVHKDAREKFEIRSHQRLIDILQPTAQTIDSLMHLDLPVGVDVEVKL